MARQQMQDLREQSADLAVASLAQNVSAIEAALRTGDAERFGE